MAHHNPSQLSYQSLKQSTHNFDKGNILGSGGFGTVYKGVHEKHGEIAVKVLHSTSGLDNKEFHKEFDILSGLKHPNIVKLVGFCNEWVKELVEYEGKQVPAERLRMALCFEFIHNGSLSKLISDEKTGLTWQTRYRIIKGICEGLKYLREAECPIMHFDLKPDNILIDKRFDPKIADFGLSRLLGEENTRKTMSTTFTRGYCPPEYIKHQIISKEFDIFSLGVIIIRIMTGHEFYNSVVEMPTRKSVKLVHEIWRKRLRENLRHTSLEVYCNQVKRCIEIALKCLISNRQERPTIQEIVSSLNETEIFIGGRGMQIEQFYQDGEVSNLPCDSSIITISSRPSSENYSLAQSRVMSFSMLKEMTDNFSEERLLGSGAHGSVYKAIDGDGQAIAVKKLHQLHGIDDREFENEIAFLMELRHQNIVQFIGFCHETKEVLAEFQGKQVVAEEIYNALCFEYLKNGPLRRYISQDMDSGLDWQTRYGIFKGMCDGLRFLHEGLESPILHVNLNPDNILMDENMMPKIGGFSAARRVYEGNVHRSFGFVAGGYLPPEFVNKQVISKEYDIYSLGAITLKLLTGSLSYHEYSEMPPQDFVELALEKWRCRLEKTVDDRLVEGYCQQAKKCLEIALRCVEFDRHKRPSIGEIVDMLDETDILIPHLEICSDSALLLDLHDSGRELLLEVYPLELWFHPAVSSSFKLSRKKKSSSCSLQLENKGNDRVAFMLVANSPKRYLAKEPLCGVVSPRCSYTLTLTMRNNKEQPPSSYSDSGGVDFFTLSSVGVQEYDLLNVDKDSIAEKYDEFFKKTKEKVQKMTLKVISDRPASDEGTPSSEPTRPTVEILTMPDAQQVLSIDMHPTEPWIMTTNRVGSLRVWNYHTMAALNSFQLAEYEPVNVANFITREKWIIVADREGDIYVYHYEDHEAQRLNAHDSCITTLVAHPTSPFVLSSSEDDDNIIKLWDWGNGWKCTREFRGHTGRVTQVTFNPEKIDCFASASLDGTVKIWSMCDDPSNIVTLELDEHGLCVGYFTRQKLQHLIVGCKDKTPQIWKLEKEVCVYELEGHEDRITAVGLHLELQMLITGSLDGTVRLWNSSTYKLENIIGFNLGPVNAFGCTKGSTRIVVGCHHGIAIIEIPRPS